MKLRIVAGKNLVIRYQHDSQLKSIYKASDFLVQGDPDVRLIRSHGNVQAFILGRILGRVVKTDAVPYIDKTDSGFKSFICSQAIDRSMNELEGRFTLLKLISDNEFEICCDRYGKMDLYYQKLDAGIVFASDLSLLPFKENTFEYDQVAAAHAVYIYGFRPAKRHTFYKGVRRLGLGEIASFKDNKISFREIPPKMLPVDNAYTEKDLDKYSDILLDAIKQCSSPQGNIVYMSSGWDSSSLLAALVKLYGPGKVRTVIGRMRLSKRSGVINPFEIERAKSITEYFGVKLEIADYDFDQRGAELIESVQHLAQSHMLTSMSFYFWVVLAEYIAKTSNGNEAVFAGEISDGVHNFGFSQFMTIPHPVLEFREYSDKMATYLFGPTFFKSVLEGKHKNDLIYNILKQKHRGGIFDEASSDKTGCARQMFESLLMRDCRVPFWSLSNNKIMTEKGRMVYTETMARDYFNKPAELAEPETLYSWYIHLYNSFHWQGGTVSTLAFAANEHGFDINLPYWDSRLHEFLAVMPESWGRGLELKPTKYPQKHMLKTRVDYPQHLQVGPHSYLSDVDRSFSPVGEFIYDSAFTPYIKKLLKAGKYEQILSREVFDMEYIGKTINNYLKGIEVTGRERNDLVGLAFLTLANCY